MKNVKLVIVCLVSSFLFNSCSDETEIFTADLNSSEIAFQNPFASEYLLSEDTKENIADRFIWNNPTPITTNTYELEASVSSDFSTITSIGNTSNIHHIVTVEQLMGLAQELNLDDDPATTDANGNPNNVGIVYFRVKATIGNGGAGTDEIVSNTASINIKVIEKILDDSCDSLYALGDAIVDYGWNFPGSEFLCMDDILEGKIKLTAGIFRFFETLDDWGSGLNYTYYKDAGYTIDANLEDAEDTDHNFKFTGTDGIYTITINDNAKTIELKESGSLWAVGGAVPGGWGFNSDTVEFVENTPNIWSASITLSNDIFRFFQTFGTWDLNNNMTYYEDQGFTIDNNFENDGGGDGNFSFTGTPGTYTLTIDANNKEITLN